MQIVVLVYRNYIRICVRTFDGGFDQFVLVLLVVYDPMQFLFIMGLRV